MSAPETDALLPHEQTDGSDVPVDDRVRKAPPTGRAVAGRGGSVYGAQSGWVWALFAVLLLLGLDILFASTGWWLGPATAPGGLPPPSSGHAVTLTSFAFWVVTTAVTGALLAALFWALNAAWLRLLHSRVKERIAAACRKSSEEDLSRFRYAGVRYDVRQRASLGGALHDIGFVELRPEELVFVGPTVSWAVPREWVKNLAPCRTKGDLDGPLPRFAKELPVPAIVYQPPYAPEPFVVSIVICERPGRKQIAEDSGRLYAELVEWAGEHSLTAASGSPCGSADVPAGE